MLRSTPLGYGEVLAHFQLLEATENITGCLDKYKGLGDNKAETGLKVKVHFYMSHSFKTGGDGCFI